MGHQFRATATVLDIVGRSVISVLHAALQVCPFSYAYRDKLAVINEQEGKQSLRDIQPRPGSRTVYTAEATRWIHGEMEMGAAAEFEFERQNVERYISGTRTKGPIQKKRLPMYGSRFDIIISEKPLGTSWKREKAEKPEKVLGWSRCRSNNCKINKDSVI
jgi:hypothetical protein